MKSAIVTAAAGLMSLCMADSAFAAYEFNPEGSSFTGTGTTSATKNGITLKCNATFKGTVDANGVGSITSGSFTGAIGCSSVKLVGLPWTSTAVSATSAKIYKVDFSSPIGSCGPGTLTTTLKSGVITFTNQPLPGSCKVSGNITTSPKLSIVNDGP